MKLTTEEQRLRAYRERTSNWKHWGPYLSDRSWGTVREDYSKYGTAWSFFPHDHARSKTYRWGEDGIAGISDRSQYLCFALSYWNGRDPILKERYFGLSADEGNHGEDVKEYYYYLDSTPTHSYMKMLYKYPQAEYPYYHLLEENKRRGKHEPEYELIDTGIFENEAYFDCFVEYAKARENDILVRITVHNRGAQEAPIDIIPTLWFRNTWSWGYPAGPMGDVPGVPMLQEERREDDIVMCRADHPTLGTYFLYAAPGGEPLYTNNESNAQRLWNLPSLSPYVKDAFHEYIVHNRADAVNPSRTGTKFGVRYHRVVPPGGQVEIELRLTHQRESAPFNISGELFTQRQAEADEFYEKVCHPAMSEDEKRIQRQAFAGMLWTKQLYYYDIEQWLKGDPVSGSPPVRFSTRNRDWVHLTNFDIISMPDKWEFPWYAAWDLAFHCISLALVDADFAKRQLELMTREWYMHPNGQLPAYEWAFGDVNPPVHAWATWRVFKIDAKHHGTEDRAFLEGIFHKLLINFTWWVNRKDVEGRNIFQGGFLGLDNIGVFDRSAPLPTGGYIDQADGTSWMASYCLSMVAIALELAQDNPIYQDSASKFLEHFLRVAHAMTRIGVKHHSLWDEEDGFFYDLLHLPDDTVVPLKVRSLVGIIPLFAVATIEHDTLEQLPDVKRRLKWFLHNRPELSGSIARFDIPGSRDRVLASLLTRDRLVRVLKRMLDEEEFLSDYGIRSLSRYHEKHPYHFEVNGTVYTVAYEPAESTLGLFGGNSNWRGPVWAPLNYLIIEALQQYHHYYGEEFKVEFPTGSGNFVTLDEVARDLSRRLIRLFERDSHGRRPCLGPYEQIQRGTNWHNYLLFNEYFHPETGMGLGASHQTGWTGLVAKLLQQCGGLEK